MDRRNVPFHFICGVSLCVFQPTIVERDKQRNRASDSPGPTAKQNLKWTDDNYSVFVYGQSIGLDRFLTILLFRYRLRVRRTADSFKSKMDSKRVQIKFNVELDRHASNPSSSAGPIQL